MFTDTNQFLKIILKATIKISVAGVIIGIFHKYDILLAIFLSIKLAYYIYKQNYFKEVIFLSGMFFTCIGGLLGEYWGVLNGFWKYHNISNNFPYWLPFAWMFAFVFLYRLEKDSFILLKNKTLTNKIILTLIFVSFYPAYGEVITIALGVWTYYWPYQILGVPLYAFICLIFLHFFVNIILVWINKKYKLKDQVFSI